LENPVKKKMLTPEMKYLIKKINEEIFIKDGDIFETILKGGKNGKNKHSSL